VTEPVDVLIIGSGPAGVSAAWPLVNYGLKVVMVEAGDTLVSPYSPNRPSLAEIRQGSSGSWADLLGSDLSGLKSAGWLSPKIRTAGGRKEYDHFVRESGVEAQNFLPVGMFALGGLSNVWGAVAIGLDDRDLINSPISLKDLAPSYERVAHRIGISGVADDDLAFFFGGGMPLQSPLSISDNTKEILEIYQRHRHALSLRLGRPRLAVLSESRGEERLNCNLDGLCMWGCNRKSYQSR
jgi:choline dehydrogenase-like flavoprotein